MNEVREITTSPTDSITISPKVLEKFSKGDIRLNEHMAIKGEGEKRKLYVSVGPDNPIYSMHTMHENRINLIREEIRKAHRSGNKGAIDKLLDEMNRLNGFKEELVKGAVSYAQLDYLDAQGDFLRREKEIPQDRSEGSIRQSQKLRTEISDYSDTLKYMLHLVNQRKFEVVFSGQKQNQTVRVGGAAI